MKIREKICRHTPRRRHFWPSSLGNGERLEPRLLLSTYYVDSMGGSDSNNGTTAPWKSLAEVDSKTFQPGDIILFKAGDSWTGQLTPHGSGTSSSWITIDDYGTGSKPLLLGSGTAATLTYGQQQYWSINDLAFSGGGAAVEIINGNAAAMVGVRLEGLVISDMGTAGQSQGNGAIWLFGWAGPINDVTIANNTITDVGSWGIWVQGANNGTTPYSTGVVVSGNDIDGTGMDGIEVDYSRNPLISSNTIEYAGAYDHPAADPYYVGLFPLWCIGGTIEHNEVAHTAGVASTGDSEAFDLDNDCSGTFYFEYNYSHDNAGGFFEDTPDSLLAAGDQCIIRYNVSQDDGNIESPDAGGGLFRISGEYVTVYNNTFYNQDGPNIVQKNYGYGDETATFTNNIFDSPYGFVSETNANGPLTNAFTFAHNLFFTGPGPADDANQVDANPDLVSPNSGGQGFASLGGYELMSSSPAINAGVAVGNNGGVDFYGNAIPQGVPTIGADQVTSTQPPTPPKVTTAASANPNPVVASTKTSLSVNATDVAGAASLSYTWSTTGTPPAAVSFSANGTNAAQTTTATFTKVGTYAFLVTVKDPSGLTATSSVSVVVSSLVAPPAPPTPPTVSDAGFETTAVAPGSYSYGTGGTAWSFSGYTGISANGSALTSGNPAAPQGSHVAILRETGSFGQSIGNWAAGSYQVSFLAAQRGNDGASREDFQVLVDGVVVSSFTPAGTSYLAYTTASFAVGVGTHTITFRGLDTVGGEDTAFIDDVSVISGGGSGGGSGTPPGGSPSSPVSPPTPPTPPAPPTPPTVSDAGFETTAVAPGSYSYGTGGTAWSFSGYTGISANGSALTSGNPAAPQGSHVAILRETGSFGQSIGNWAAGSYQVSFLAAQRGNDGASREDFQVLVDGVVVSSFTPAGTSYLAYTTASFAVGVGTHTITFRGLDTVGGEDTAFIDDVSVISGGGSGGGSGTPPGGSPSSPVSPRAGAGGFETPAVDAGSYTDSSYDPTGASWAFAGFSGSAGNGSGITAGTNAPGGTQAAFLQMTGSSSLTFSAAQRLGPNQNFRILVGGHVVGTFDPSGTSYQA